MNSGRLRSRINGAELAKYENLIYIDSRVHMEPKAILQLFNIIRQDPTVTCAVSTIQYADGQPIVSYFWEGLEHLAWYRYYTSAEDIELTKENFNAVPKGTTMIYFRKTNLVSHYQYMEQKHTIDHETNDDTLLLREFLDANKVVISRNFKATYGKHEVVELSGAAGKAVLVGAGLGHGFVSLADASTVAYLLSSPFSPGDEYEINPLDPELGIDWVLPRSELKLSPKDQAAPSLKDRLGEGTHFSQSES